MNNNSNLLRLSEVAKLYNISRQTVYNYVKEIEEQENPEEYIQIVENIKRLTLKGQEAIKQKAGVTDEEIKETIKDTIKQDKQAKNVEQAPYMLKYIEQLEKENENLTKQVEIKDEQIQVLNDLIKNNNNALTEMIKSTREANYLEYVEQEKEKEKDTQQEQKPEETKKKGFFSRLFNR